MSVAISSVQSDGKKIPDEAVIILPQTPNKYQTAFLDLLDIPTEKRVIADKNCIKLAHLLLPSVRRNGRAVSRAGLDAFRTLSLRSLPERSSENNSRRIYLSRKDAQTRRVLNEPEIETLLHAHGFTTVRTEHMSLAEQITLFSKAEIIVSPHGAGLANTIFATTPHIIEFLPADLWDLGYFVGLTTSCGGTYSGIVCSGVAAGDDMAVDLTTLDEILTDKVYSD